MQSVRLTVVLLVVGLLAPAVPALAQSFDARALGRKPDVPVARPKDRGTGVRACPEYGAGFYRLAGSDTCIRIGGGIGSEIGTSSTRR